MLRYSDFEISVSFFDEYLVFDVNPFIYGKDNLNVHLRKNTVNEKLHVHTKNKNDFFKNRAQF